MARRLIVLGSIIIVVGVLLGYSVWPGAPSSQETMAGANNPEAGDRTFPETREPSAVAEEERRRQEREVLSTARLYMEKQGLKVGNGPGEIVLSPENVWENKAVVLYGFAASEFFAELGLRCQDGKWRVTHDQARYCIYEDLGDGLAVLASSEGLVLGAEPGKYLVGAKDVKPGQIVLLVAPYGEPWAWEYSLAKKQDSWVVAAKNKAEERWEPAR